MTRVLFWKEYREQRQQVIILTQLAVLALVAAVPMYKFGMTDNTMILSFTMLFAWACAMVTGAILLANESETATQSFLDYLPGWRRQLWLTKLMFGAAVTGVQVAILTAVCFAMRTTGEAELPRWQYLEILYAAVLGLGCGIAGSALGRSVLAAVGWSFVVAGVNVAFHSAAFYLVISAADLAPLSVREFEHIAIHYAAAGATLVSTMVLPFLVSRWLYTRVDRRRQTSERFAGFVRRRARAGWGVVATLWMSLKQGWPVYAVLGVAALVVGPLLWVEPVLLWPLVTLLVGCLAGITAFADEQRLGSFRFLAEQRLPLGRLWVVKVASRFALAAGVVFVLLAAAFVAIAILSGVAGPRAFAEINFEANRHHESDFFLFRNLGWRSFMVVWVIYGYAFGLLGGMLARKTFVALSLAFPAAVIALSPWVPSFYAGGLPVGQMFVVPIGLLVLARWSVWPWATDRILSRSNLRRWGAAVLLACVWTAGCLAYRVWEVPAHAAPFSVAEFQGGYRALEKSEAPSLMRSAVSQRTAHIQKLIDTGLLPATFHNRQSDNNTPPRVPDFHERLSAVCLHGWPAADPTFETQLDRIAAGEWVETLQKVATLPPGAFMRPIADFPVPELFPLGQTLTARALQLQHRGDSDSALDLFIDQLAMARHAMTRTAVFPYLQATQLETTALRGLDVWSRHPDVSAAMLARALAELQRHERARPPFADAVKVEYLIDLDSFSSPGRITQRQFRNQEDRWKDALLLLPMIAPWERERRMRLENWHAGLRQGLADADFPTLLARARLVRGFDPDQEQWGFGIIPPGATEEENRHRDRLRELVLEDPATRPNLGFMSQGSTTWFVSLCRVRASQLRVALLLYQHRRGKPAERLADLVPDILAELPDDPFRNAPFGYRLAADGEEIVWRREKALVDGSDEWVVVDNELNVAPAGAGPGVPAAVKTHYRPAKRGENATHRRVLPGQAVLWAAGMDGRDDGGVRQTYHESNGMSEVTANSKIDMIFVIPKVAK